MDTGCVRQQSRTSDLHLNCAATSRRGEICRSISPMQVRGMGAVSSQIRRSRTSSPLPPENDMASTMLMSLASLWSDEAIIVSAIFTSWSLGARQDAGMARGVMLQ